MYINAKANAKPSQQINIAANWRGRQEVKRILILAIVTILLIDVPKYRRSGLNACRRSIVKALRLLVVNGRGLRQFWVVPSSGVVDIFDCRDSCRSREDSLWYGSTGRVRLTYYRLIAAWTVDVGA